MKKNKNIITGIALTILLLGSTGASADENDTLAQCLAKPGHSYSYGCKHHLDDPKTTTKGGGSGKSEEKKFLGIANNIWIAAGLSVGIYFIVDSVKVNMTPNSITVSVPLN